MGSHDSGEEFGQPGASFGALAGFVFCRAVEISSGENPR